MQPPMTPIRKSRSDFAACNLGPARVLSGAGGWLANDRSNGRYASNLKSLAGIYIDCGWRDQFQIHYGTRILSRRLSAAGVAHRYEEFDDDHSDVDYRMDVSLPFLYRALKP